MKKKNKIKGQFVAKVDRGRVRITNEDQALAITNSNGDVLLAVADGMGGHLKGDYASKAAITMLQDAFYSRNDFHHPFLEKFWLAKVIKNINRFIYDEAYNHADYKDMGTTLVVALLIKDSIIIANVGDSRAYRISSEMELLSEDQTYVNYLYRIGKIKEDEMKTRLDRHVLTNAVGIYPTITIQTKIISNSGNSILLCSDGLYNNISEKEMNAILKSNDLLEDKIQTLISVANSNGGSDNIAISYWEKIGSD